jgi:predicted GIY-YIG superfamily endonuclease
MPFDCVYLLNSLSHPKAHYVGITQNLQDRLHKHNAGEVPHTSALKPWKISVAIAFHDHFKATRFER